MIKRLILTAFAILSLLCASEAESLTPLTYDESLALLNRIDQEAIVLGNGAKQVYVFIDPLCLHSRKFIAMVSQNPKMLSKYQYHLFLYSITRLKSQEDVAAIYASDAPLATLLEVMTTPKRYQQKATTSTQAKVESIASVARKLSVHKRPYIFVAK